MRRVPWDVLLALLIGLGLGLVYSWVISPLSPLRVFSAEPTTLRADFKDQYRSLIAAAYAATGNLPRARARLALLGDSNSVEALNGQAQRMQASGQAFERAEQVVALAHALGGEDTSEAGTNHAPASTPTIEEAASNIDNIASATSLPPLSESEVPLDLTEAPQVIETETIAVQTTPRPTNTSTLVPGEPFALTGQETICDPNLPNGLLQVVVLNSRRRQVAGVEIDITWDGGQEQFFSGLKPELGNGYADYTMTPDITYSIQLAQGSDVALGVTAPTCQSSDGVTFLGGIKLTFQQP
jgi:hypothetical protein